MSESIVLPQLYVPLFGAISINHSRSPSWGNPSEWDILGIDALLVTQRDEKLLIGERIRHKDYEHYQDITVRWRSSITGELLEPHSLNCQYFVYGYVDEIQKTLLSWWVLYSTKLLEFIRSGVVKGQEAANNTKGGSIFRAFKPHMLERAGCIYRHGVGRLALANKEPPVPVIKTVGKATIKQYSFQWQGNNGKEGGNVA